MFCGVQRVGDLIIVSVFPLYIALFYFLLFYSLHRQVEIWCNEFLEVLTQQTSLFSKATAVYYIMTHILHNNIHLCSIWEMCAIYLMDYNNCLKATTIFKVNMCFGMHTNFLKNILFTPYAVITQSVVYMKGTVFKNGFLSRWFIIVPPESCKEST